MAVDRWAQAPAEQAGYDAAQAAADQVNRDLGANLHSGEVMAAHQGSPSIEVQHHTHGAGLPPVDRGK